MPKTGASPEGNMDDFRSGRAEIEAQPVKVPVTEVKIELPTGEELEISNVPSGGASCVDGRTSREVSQKRPAIYGGSWGALMAALAVAMEKNPNLAKRLLEEETLEQFIEFLREKHQEYGIDFYIHTDKHAQEQAQEGVGCGHTQAQIYSGYLNQEQSDAINSLYHRLLDVATDVKSLPEDYNNGAIVKEVLVGHHAEEEVLVNDTPATTFDRAGGTRFVRDQWAEVPVIKLMVAWVYLYLKGEGLLGNVTFEEFTKAALEKYKEQVKITNEKLGVNDMPKKHVPTA